MSFDRGTQLADFATRDPRDPALRLARKRERLSGAFTAVPAVDHNGHPVDDTVPSPASWAQQTAERQQTDAAVADAIEFLTPHLGADEAAKVVAEARAAGGTEAIISTMVDVADEVAAQIAGLKG